MDVLSVFKASSQEDFKDVMGLLPQGTPLPASDKMTYLLARLEVKGFRVGREEGRGDDLNGLRGGLLPCSDLCL